MEKRLRVAQVAPLMESVPPRGYGGTERVVSYLTEELVRRGCDVTLFAAGDSRTRAHLVPCAPRALRTDPDCRDTMPHMAYLLERVVQAARDFDVLHFHIDWLHYPLCRHFGWPALTTFHGRLDLRDLAVLHSEFSDIAAVSVSDSQRRPAPGLRWLSTVYHGLPVDLYKPGPGGEGLCFIGRTSREKRLDRALELAKRTGRTLAIAAKIDPSQKAYYDEVLRPMMRSAPAEFRGEVDEAGKQELLGASAVFLYPIDWPEPFGLAMIEAMACGTPVVAFRAGSTSEIVDEGVTGFVVDTLDQAEEAVAKAARLDRAKVRETFERRFSAERMAEEYLALYHRLAGVPA